ncbi:MAG: DMT family transporter [Raoultibacter sp.]
MRSSILKYSLFVFLGGVSYGIIATIAKLAYAQGFSWSQVVVSQGLFAVLYFAVLFAIQVACGRKPVRVSPIQVGKLLVLGCCTCTTAIFYYYSLTMLPASIAVTLLFQFTWIGMILQVVTTHRAPSGAEIVAILMIFAGTLFASGFLSSSAGGAIDFASFNPFGIICGLLSALSCALFVFFSGRFETDMPPIQRGFITCCGTLLLGLCVCPTYFSSGALFEGIAGYGVLLGLFGLFFPVLLFGLGAPHLPAGVSTIMASSELPSSVLFSLVVLQEHVDAFQAAGITVILIGVVVSQLPNLIPDKTKKKLAHQDNSS